KSWPTRRGSYRHRSPQRRLALHDRITEAALSEPPRIKISNSTTARAGRKWSAWENLAPAADSNSRQRLPLHAILERRGEGTPPEDAPRVDPTAPPPGPGRPGAAVLRRVGRSPEPGPVLRLL